MLKQPQPPRKGVDFRSGVATHNNNIKVLYRSRRSSRVTRGCDNENFDNDLKKFNDNIINYFYYYNRGARGAVLHTSPQ